ncbi:MAG: response regulator [Ktedonobacterales bacterium]
MHLLIVDDDPEVRTLLSAVLDENVQDVQDVQEAPDGLRALEHLRGSTEPVIVLLDWHMPQLDGQGVLRAVAADPRLAEMHRFILITGTNVSDDPEGAALLRQLQVSIIPKPFDLDAVIAAVVQADACLGLPFGRL